MVQSPSITSDCNRNFCARKGCLPKTPGRHFSEVLEEGESLCDGRPLSLPGQLPTGAKSEAMHSRVDTQSRLQDLKLYTLPGFNAKGELTNMVEKRRDITKRARMASEFNFVWPTQGHAGDMDANAMAQKSRLGMDAKRVLSLLPVLSMPAVTDEDPGA
ncbi:hypothetical protein [Desulfocurvibacter africanus]|uniref:hypothetical protein n=1 Tax=Desulfocurvibacter africanus TaxID=873 RepID=UPI00031477E7|nr:hypothetical protein [Desulfocurvibacter africanus]